MLTTHIDTLTEWWESAEDGIGKAGDVVIERDDSPNFETASYAVFTLGRDEHENLTYRRILHRAPIPKPAWHDAPAVTATYRDDYGTVTGVWTPSGNHGYWIGPEDDVVTHDSLEAVTPLIEAKVTDEMVERATRAVINWEYRPRLDTTITLDLGDKGSRALVNNVLTAALGLETT